MKTNTNFKHKMTDRGVLFEFENKTVFFNGQFYLLTDEQKSLHISEIARFASLNKLTEHPPLYFDEFENCYFIKSLKSNLIYQGKKFKSDFDVMFIETKDGLFVFEEMDNFYQYYGNRTSGEILKEHLNTKENIIDIFKEINERNIKDVKTEIEQLNKKLTSLNAKRKMFDEPEKLFY